MFVAIAATVTCAEPACAPSSAVVGALTFAVGTPTPPAAMPMFAASVNAFARFAAFAPTVMKEDARMSPVPTSARVLAWLVTSASTSATLTLKPPRPNEDERASAVLLPSARTDTDVDVSTDPSSDALTAPPSSAFAK